MRFPNLSQREEQLIRKWSNRHGYQCTIDKNVNKAIVRNPINNKIAYIQKEYGELRLVFNNRFESLTMLIAMEQINTVLCGKFAIKGQIKGFMDTLHHSLELSR